jgi:hypothetical protein
MLMAAFTGVLVPIFGGAISVKTSAVAAVGGCAVWLTFPFIFGEMPSNMTVTVLLDVNGVPLSQPVTVEVRYRDETEKATSSTNGEVMFRVPSGLSAIDSIVVGVGTIYKPKTAGPYTVTIGKSISLELIKKPVDGPDESKRQPHEGVEIPAIPDKDEVLNHKALNAEEVTIEYHNKSQSDLTLWLFNCWKYHKDMQNKWKKIAFPRTEHPLLYDEFRSDLDGNGVYCILIEYETGKFKCFGRHNLFDSALCRLVASGTNDNNIDLKVN